MSDTRPETDDTLKGPDGLAGSNIDQTKDPEGSFFVTEMFGTGLTDEEIAEKMKTIPSAMFSLKVPTEVEILTCVYEALDALPKIDDIQALHEAHQYDALAHKCQSFRDDLLELIRLSINSYREEYMPGNVRDTDKISALYEATTAVNQSNIIRALEYLKQLHPGSYVLYNAEAVIRSMSLY